MVVLPEGKYEQLHSLLEERGIPVVDYKAGDIASRRQAVNSIEGIKFKNSTASFANKINTTGEGGVRSVAKNAANSYADYDKPITSADIAELQKIERKSINKFSQAELILARKWAYKFQRELGAKSLFSVRGSVIGEQTLLILLKLYQLPMAKSESQLQQKDCQKSRYGKSEYRGR